MALAIIYCIVAAIFGIIFCFFGYRYLKKMFIGLGLLIGTMVAYILLAPVLSPLLAIIVSLLIGALSGILLYYLSVVGIFITGASFGMIVSLIVCMFAGWNYTSTVALVIMGVISITTSVLAVVFRRGLMIIATSFTGSYFIVMNAGFLFTSITPSVRLTNLADKMDYFFNANSTLLIWTILALAVVGCLMQFLLTAPDRRKRKK